MGERIIMEGYKREGEYKRNMIGKDEKRNERQQTGTRQGQARQRG